MSNAIRTTLNRYLHDLTGIYLYPPENIDTLEYSLKEYRREYLKEYIQECLQDII